MDTFEIDCNTCYNIFCSDITMYFDYLKDIKICYNLKSI